MVNYLAMPLAGDGVLRTLGQIAGIGGLALGVVLLIFRSVIAKKIFPRLDRQDAFRLLRLIIVLAWSIGVLGILVYAFQKPKQSTPRLVGFLQFSDPVINTNYSLIASGKVIGMNLGFVAKVQPVRDAYTFMTLNGGWACGPHNSQTDPRVRHDAIAASCRLRRIGGAGHDSAHVGEVGTIRKTKEVL